MSDMQELWLFALLGVILGFVGLLMIRVLFFLEDWFDDFRLKPAAIWAPVAGALVLGIIGYFYPQIFGTGYDTIRAMLTDKLTVSKLLGVSIAKFWALVISLGSGTTGGVFAPSLIVGGGIGSAYAAAWHHYFPHFVSDPAFYALIAMAGSFAGIARAPFTSIIFLLELSRNPNALPPLIICCMISDAVVRTFSTESIMTGKLVKRGLIVLQDYSVPIVLRARIDQVMQKDFASIPADADVKSVVEKFPLETLDALPVVGQDGKLLGILDARDLVKWRDLSPDDGGRKAGDMCRNDYVVAYPADTIDQVTREMLARNVEHAVVVDRAHSRPIGVARAADILKVRRWVMEEEGVKVEG